MIHEPRTFKFWAQHDYFQEKKYNAKQTFSHKNVKTMLCKHVCLPDHKKNKHAWFMNQELLNSEPNMIIFRKKMQCKANFSH